MLFGNYVAARRRHTHMMPIRFCRAPPTRFGAFDEVSRVFGERKAQLERRGKRMSDFDLAIAAHAIAFDLIVVTADSALERLRLQREIWQFHDPTGNDQPGARNDHGP